MEWRGKEVSQPRVYDGVGICQVGDLLQEGRLRQDVCSHQHQVLPLISPILSCEVFNSLSQKEGERELQVWVLQLDVQVCQVLHIERFTCDVIEQVLEA